MFLRGVDHRVEFGKVSVRQGILGRDTHVGLILQESGEEIQGERIHHWKLLGERLGRVERKIFLVFREFADTRPCSFSGCSK